MKIIAVLLIGFFVLCCAETKPSWSQRHNSLLMKLHAKKGETFLLKSVYKTFLTSKSILRTQVNAEYTAIVEDVASDGKVRFGITLNRFGFSVYSDDRKVIVNLDSKKKPPQKMKQVVQELYAGVMQTIGFKCWMELAENGEIMATNVDTSISVQKGDQDINGMLSGDCKVLIGIISFSTSPVKVTDTWKAISMLNKEGKVLSGTSNFRLDALTNSTAEISFSSKGWGDVPDGNSITASFEGSASVDIRTGLPKKTTVKSKMGSSNPIVNDAKTETVIEMTKLPGLSQSMN